MKGMETMDSPNPEMQIPATKRQRYNQRPGREAVVRIPVEGIQKTIEIAIVGLDPRTGTVELEIPTEATIGHRSQKERES